MGRYSDRLADLIATGGWPPDLPAPDLHATADGFEAALSLTDGTRVVITTDGRIRVRQP
jgi:hypothetical protein